MNTSPEQQIRRIFPDAVCVSQKIPGGTRYVIRPSNSIANPIRIGATEKAAWIAAASRVKVEVRG